LDFRGHFQVGERKRGEREKQGKGRNGKMGENTYLK